MGNKPQLLSGARGKIVVNGKIWGYATDISIDAPVSVRAVHTLNSVSARSVETLQAGPCTVSIGRVIPVSNMDGTPLDTSAINTQAAPTIINMLKSEDITIDLVDNVTGKTYASVRNCRFAGRSMSLSASSLASERLSFMGIYDAGSGTNTHTPGFN